MKLVFVVDREVVVPDQQVDLREVEPGVYSLIRNGRSFEVRLFPLPSESTYEAVVQGRHFQVEVRDPREFSRRSGAGFGTGRQNVMASMPGKVVRVLVRAGEDVEPGQGLVVVEAMKMQNEMKATKPGKVAKVHVNNGDTVGAGQLLLVIE